MAFLPTPAQHLVSMQSFAPTWTGSNCPVPIIHIHININKYFVFPVSGRRMKRFLRFRLSSHSLPIEAGRRTRPQTPCSARVCPHCSSQAVGDEKHLVFECPFLQPIRSKYPWGGIWKLFVWPPSPVNEPLFLSERPHECLHVHFGLSRHGWHIVLCSWVGNFFLAHPHSLVGWLGCKTLPPLLSAGSQC